MKIPRYYKNIDPYLMPGKALILLGARQVGKTTLVKDYLDNCPENSRYFTGEDIRIREIFNSGDLDRIVKFFSNYKILVIDEAHKINGIGLGLKLLVDHVPDIRIIATGSSSFSLTGQIGEPLTGRKISLTLYPVAHLEMRLLENDFDIKNELDRYLIYGSYPEILVHPDNRTKGLLLDELMGSYLLKDILELDKIRNSRTLLDMLRLLAFQVGSEVSLHEIGMKLGLDGKTVARYLDILEKSFVIFSLGGYSGNLRNEITRKNKYYFLDNGMRNAVIANYNEIDLRNDIGQLWENFLVVERLKKQSYARIFCNNYFWRTWRHHEVDWIEEREGKLFAYEFKWGKGTAKGLKKFKEVYPDSECTVIDQTNYLDFIT